MKKFFLKNRILWVILSAVLGIFLAYYFSLLKKNCDFDFLENDKIFGTLFLVILSLPTGFYLWYLRNKDKLAQLQKANESNNFNNFSNAMNLFAQENNKTAKAIGLKLLMELKHKKLYDEKQIDLATQNSDLKNLDLEGADLSRGNFKRCDFSGANLKDANLQGANFRNVVFYSANQTDALSGKKRNLGFMERIKLANLQKANLENANLQGAYFGSVNLHGAYLHRAKLDEIYLTISYKDLEALPKKNNIPRKEIENFLTKFIFFTYDGTERIIIKQETDDLHGTYKIEKRKYKYEKIY